MIFSPLQAEMISTHIWYKC